MRAEPAATAGPVVPVGRGRVFPHSGIPAVCAATLKHRSQIDRRPREEVVRRQLFGGDTVRGTYGAGGAEREPLSHRPGRRDRCNGIPAGQGRLSVVCGVLRAACGRRATGWRKNASQRAGHLAAGISQRAAGSGQRAAAGAAESGQVRVRRRYSAAPKRRAKRVARCRAYHWRRAAFVECRLLRFPSGIVLPFPLFRGGVSRSSH